jgi:hypothetical protein
MSAFNTEWNRLGPADAASRVRDAIEYLLYGPEDTYIEDRLTNLINGVRGSGMKGFREALLTKACVWPNRSDSSRYWSAPARPESMKSSGQYTA